MACTGGSITYFHMKIAAVSERNVDFELQLEITSHFFANITNNSFGIMNMLYALQ
jgi:hypothetical protein